MRHPRQSAATLAGRPRRLSPQPLLAAMALGGLGAALPLAALLDSVPVWPLTLGALASLAAALWLLAAAPLRASGRGEHAFDFQDEMSASRNAELRAQLLI